MVQVAPYTLIASYSIEGIFLGINCVLYAFCIYTLWGQKAIPSRALLLINTVQFLLCVTQINFHTAFYFTVFTVLNGDIQPYLQDVNVYILGSVVIFNITFITTGFLSIWRLHVLYENGIVVCIPALIVWIAQICMSAITIRICATTPVVSTSFNLFHSLLWALITVLNLYVAIPTCIRLYIAQRRAHTVLSPSPYKSIAIVLVECSALITACSVAMTILYACNYTYALVSDGVATEIAIASQLLVTARHGMLSQGRPTPSPTSTMFGPNMMRTESRHTTDRSTAEPVKPKMPCLLSEPTSRDQKGFGWDLTQETTY